MSMKENPVSQNGNAARQTVINHDWKSAVGHQVSNMQEAESQGRPEDIFQDTELASER